MASILSSITHSLASGRHGSSISGGANAANAARIRRCCKPLLLAHRHSRATRRVVAASAWAPTPHSGYHFDGSPRRFFEGWYWKVTDPDSGQSFALIYSVEDPGDARSGTRGVGVQVMGADDGYICQFSRDTGGFWAARNSLELGATFRPAAAAGGGGAAAGAAGARQRPPPRRMLPQAEFDAAVELGFQASATWQQGSIVAAEAGAAGAPMSTVQRCSWALRIDPLVGWGDASAAAAATSSSSGGGLDASSSGSSSSGSSGSPSGGAVAGRATAGWLSALSVFEPHWQVLMAHGTADGWVQWGDRRFELRGAPAYAEKNWGGGFPSKWLWVQCNTFGGYPGLSVTAVGARRGLLGVPGLEEDVGMVGVHLPDGRFLELTPWAGDVEWSADAWGRWWLRARGGGHEAVVEAECAREAGTTLRCAF